MFQQLLWQTIINCRTIFKIKQFSKLGHFVLMNTIQKFNLRSITTVEAVNWRCSVKKVFLEISQHSQKNTCARVLFLIKLQTEACNFIKKRLWPRCFPVKFLKFLRTTFLTEHFWWLLLSSIRSFSKSEILLAFN